MSSDIIERDSNDKCSPFSFFAVYPDGSLVKKDDFSGDRQAKPGTSGLPGTCLIHAVETLKDTFLAILRYSHSIIANPDIEEFYL